MADVLVRRAVFFFVIMYRRPPRLARTETLVPYTRLLRSGGPGKARELRVRPVAIVARDIAEAHTADRAHRKANESPEIGGGRKPVRRQGREPVIGGRDLRLRADREGAALMLDAAPCPAPQAKIGAAARAPGTNSADGSQREGGDRQSNRLKSRN